MRRVIFIVLCILIGLVAAYFGQPYVHHNADLILIIVTVFTVFAGFLIAIIAILGDPIMIPDGSWRLAERGRAGVQRRLTSHVWLFVFYLITIGLLFTVAIFAKALDEHNIVKMWIEWACLFFGVTSFLFTFALPGALSELQQSRYDAEIERRRRNVGIGTEGGGGETTDG
jgi:hypothetical protein